MNRGLFVIALTASAAVCAAAIAVSQAWSQQSPTAAMQSAEPPPHTGQWPDLSTGQTEGIREASLTLGPEFQRGFPARSMLAERRRLDNALANLKPHRPGAIDAYVVSVALDSDPVFAREAREAGRVLSRRYDAAGRSVTLAGPDGYTADLPRGSISALTLVLARIAELMNPAEDVLVLYSTSHGAPQGLAYHEGDLGYGLLSPQRLADVLTELGIKRRVILLSACYSGVFVPHLASADSVIITAASHERTSFGCQADNDWTYFGDALINHAMRKRQALATVAREAQATIRQWETQEKLEPSQPQVVIGRGAERWLPTLETRMPRSETSPVGKPAVAE